MLFENNWLARYPCPSCCIHDNGGEFTGAAFSHMLHANGIKDITTTVKNSQANAICERLHQSVSNTLRSKLRAYLSNNIEQTNDVMDTCFATAPYASKVAINCTLNISPGALVLHRDMILNIPPLLIYINYIQGNKASLMNVYNMLIYNDDLWIINLVMKF